MSLLDTASLIVTPNGYKEGKLYSVIPSDGSGDLSVTRATTATRVNSAGLVELVPYNLLQYSQQFDNGYWIQFNSTITANNTTAPDGTLTADRINLTGGFGSTYVSSFSFSGNQTTISCYFKKGTNTTFYIDSNGTAGYFGAGFNLDTEVITPFGSVISSNIENLNNNGWYRCSLVVAASGSNYIAFGIQQATIGLTGYLWGAQVNEGTIKPYQKTETRLNIPRLDYSNGTCPSILVEPQRTNLFTYSSSFDNAAWGKDTSVTITANYSTSPSGIQDADRFQKNATSGVEGITQNQFGLSSGAKTFSVYLKSNTGSNQSAFLLYANYQTQAITITSEWQRFDIVFNAITTVDYLGIVATSALDVSIWGAQLEAGSYATSYIPTTSASVTRNADVISKTGISSLIGQTEGTFFLDMYYDGVSSNFVLMQTFQNASQFNVIQLYLNSFKRLAFEVGNDAAILSPNSLVAGRYKMAGAYKNNDFVLYLNGDLIGTDTSGAVIATDAITFNDYFALPSTYKQVMEINASALWKTRLTNAQLATLTTI